MSLADAAEVTRTHAMFVSSRRLVLLDQFRIPYQVQPPVIHGGLERLQPAAGGPALLWLSAGDAEPVSATVLGVGDEPSIQLFSRVVPDRHAERLLADEGGRWERDRLLMAADGRQLASIWRREDGSVFLPFDPDGAVTNCWSERYGVAAGGGVARRLRRALMRAYYRLRPVLPRTMQLLVRRRFARVQARTPFPRWPIETCLHDFFELVFSRLAAIAGEPVPCIAPWPDDRAWALVLTHDVEQAAGLAAVGPVLELEQARGLRSSWNIVPRRYRVDALRIREIVAHGHEVGVHGLYHDGRDLESLETWRRRLPDICAAAARWGASGFRSPSTHRQWEWMPLLGSSFDYDSSYPDTDPFEPQGGGCCTWLPFFNGAIVELPMTLAQDHTLFAILRRDDETVWVEKASFLRERGGMALIDTHPDYLVDDRILAAYTRFLDRFASDPSVWNALPREVSAWWRRRAASTLERRGDEWVVVGPAATDGRVEFLGGDL